MELCAQCGESSDERVCGEGGTHTDCKQSCQGPACAKCWEENIPLGEVLTTEVNLVEYVLTNPEAYPGGFTAIGKHGEVLEACLNNSPGDLRVPSDIAELVRSAVSAAPETPKKAEEPVPEEEETPKELALEEEGETPKELSLIHI